MIEVNGLPEGDRDRGHDNQIYHFLMLEVFTKHFYGLGRRLSK